MLASLTIRSTGIFWLATGLSSIATAQTGPSHLAPAELPAGSQAKLANSTDQTIIDAAAKAKAASTIDDFNQVIKLCDEIAKGNAQQRDYAKKLEAWAYNKRGEKYVSDGDEKQALKDFETAAELDPKLVKAVHNRGVSRAGQGDIQGAMADFSTVIKMDPKYAKAWYNRGELKYDQGDFSGALQDYDQAISLNSNDAGFYNSRGHANYRLSRVRDAIRDYSQAVRIDPNDAAMLVNRGDAYRDQGAFGPAAADFREAIRLNPKLGRAYLSAAWLMATCSDAKYRDPEKAVSAAEKALDLDGDKDYRYLDTLAAAQANAGQFDLAKATIAKALAAVPKSESTRVQQRLRLYESNRAYREGAPAESVRAASASRAP
jgi:tetratricopeptide (TPR) repeat protein